MIPAKMMSGIETKILLDSITEGGSRLTTWELTYHRMFHAEVMTHREFSRNAASSRAIPASKLRKRVIDNPAVPVHWGANQKGMQALTEVADPVAAREWWLRGRDLMVKHHEEGEQLGLHKQIVNRTIEPWMMITIICSMTSPANLFYLRHHKDAEPGFQKLASLMRSDYYESTPKYLSPGEWHTPLVSSEDVGPANGLVAQGGPGFDSTSELIRKISTGRCARVSYLTHDGKRDLLEDIRLHDQLAATASLGAEPMHASPFEHVAQAVGGRQRIGNFEGWKQYRKFFPREAGPDTSVRCSQCGIWNEEHTRGCSNQPASFWTQGGQWLWQQS